MVDSVNRDVKLSITTSANGTEKIAELKATIEALAREAGAGAPDLQKISAAVEQLGKQSAAIETVRKLDLALGDLVAVESAAATKSERLGAELTALTRTSQALASEQRVAAREVNTAANALELAKSQFKLLNIETDAATRRTEAFQNAQREIKLEIFESEKKVKDLGLSYRAISEGVKEADAAQKRLVKSISEANAELNQARTAVSAQNTAIASAKLAVTELGVAEKNLTDQQIQLSVAFIKTESAVKQQAAAFATAKANAAAQAAEAEKLANAQRKVAEASEQSAKSISDAFSAVGTRSIATVNAEIEKVRAAMQTLKSTGALTGAELQQAFVKGESAISGLQREIRSLNGTMTITDRLAGAVSGSLSRIAVGNVIANGIGLITQKASEVAVEFVKTVAQAEQFQKALTAVYGSSALAASQFSFLKATANAAGVSVAGLEKDFVKYSAATKSANIPLETTNGLFAALTRGASALGASSEDVSGAINALGQIASKGTVSMEELRQQLGDRIPGALGIAAKGLGITEKQLIALVESGQLASRDFFPAFKAGLEGIRADADGLTNNWNRLLNAFRSTFQAVGDAGGLDILKGALSVLGVVIGGVVVALQSLFELFTLVAKGATALAIAFSNPTEALKYFSKEVNESSKRVDDTAAKFGLMGDAAQKAAYETEKVKVAAQGQAVVEKDRAVALTATATAADTVAAAQTKVAETATKVTTTATAQVAASTAVVAASTAQAASLNQVSLNTQALTLAKELGISVTDKAAIANLKMDLSLQNLREAVDVTREPIGKLGEKTEALSKAQEFANKTAAVLASTTTDVSRKQTELATAYAESIKDIDAQVVANEKLVKAAKELGDAATARVALQGNVNATALAEVEAANAVLAAQETLTKSRKDELDTITLQRETRAGLLVQQGLTAEAIKNELAATDQKIEKTKADLEQDNAKVESAKSLLATRKADSASLADNSKNVEENRKKANDLLIVIEALTRAKAAGAEVTKQLADADRDFGLAVALLKDGLKDEVENVKADKNEKKAAADVTINAAKNAAQYHTELARGAELIGNSRLATQELILAKRSEIEALRVTAQSKRDEADAEEEVIAAEYEAAKAAGTLTAAQEREFDRRINLIKIIDQEAEATDRSVAAKQRELVALQNLGKLPPKSGSGSNGNKGGSEGGTNGDKKGDENKFENGINIDRTPASKSLQTGGSGQQAVDKDGKVNNNATNLLPVKEAFEIQAKLLAGKIGADDLEGAKAAVKQAEAARGYLDSVQSVNSGTVSNDAITSSDGLLASAKRALEQAQEAVDIEARRAKAKTNVPTQGAVPAAQEPVSEATRELNAAKLSASFGNKDVKATQSSDGKTVTINLGGASTRVSVTSEADRNALIALLRQIEQAAGSSVR
jgi:tape measure domain-containing protein